MTLVLPQPPSKPRPPATVLQGPADADAFRVKVGRYKERYYCDPLPTCPIAEATDEHWPSVSRIKSAKPFEGANYVAMKRIAQKMASGWRPDSMEVHDDHVAKSSYDAIYEDLKLVDKLGLQAAGQRGTHVHKMAEQMLYGLPVDEDGPGAAYLWALRDFFDAYQPELVAAEVVCIVRSAPNAPGWGGTADAIVRIDGKNYLVDWKSRSPESDHAAYPEEGAQLAAYGMADYVIVSGPDGQAVRAEMPELDGALILSIKPDGVRVYPINLVSATRYWLGLLAWWEARQTEDAHIGKPWPTKRAQPAETPLEAAVAHKRVPSPAQSRALAASLKQPPGVVASSAPKAPKPDEGEPADPQAVEALQARFKAMPDNAKLAMKRIAEEAQAADRPISVAQNPSVRRFEIARLLIGWVSYDKPKDETSAEYRQWLTESPSEDLLRDVLTLVLGTDAASQPGVPVGAAVSLLDPGTARRCTEIFDRLAAGAALSVDEAGRPVLLAA